MHKTAHWAQWVIVALFGLYLGAQFINAAGGDSDRDFHYRLFASLPVQENGRVKPLDTVARTRLMLINHKQTAKVEVGRDDWKTVPADKWLLDVMSLTVAANGNPRPAVEYKIFRVENEEVLGLLHLEPRPGSWRYSYAEIGKRTKELTDEALKADEVEPRDRTLFQNKVLELMGHLRMFTELAKLEAPGVIPAEGTNKWASLADAERVGQAHGKMHPLAELFLGMLEDYSNGNVKGFNEGVKTYRAVFEKKMPDVVSAADTEVYVNELAPFYHCSVLYAFVFVLACVSWLGWFDTLNRAAFWSMVLIVAVHTWALLIRIYLQGRPPVTNLYSSAIFIGWGCAVTCLVFEGFYRNSIALAVGSATGGLSLLIAHFLSLDSGDTMEMMQAVLDTNFWLATHVTCVTLGYTATFVAGFMGVTYVLAMASSAAMGLLARWHVGARAFLESPESKIGVRGFFTRFFDTDAASVMGRMLYGIVCFGMFLSFTGTVLGGLWADVSWGRFWGWDPKENGALLIVIWCALILHARWGGLVKQRGIAVLAVLGNIVTAWSWFGTNLLGVGLHAYGFMSGAMTWLIVFDVLMLVIAGIGLLPLRQWAKLTPQTQSVPADPVMGARAESSPAAGVARTIG
jgi:ABC-type transport system involved in cytochrome c biogenesis permease subunit